MEKHKKLSNNMKQAFTKDISTENGINEFRVRILKDDGVGLLTTPREENYLILDSLDYWYDLIQSGYPKKKKCSCKNDLFFVQFNYVLRQESNDVSEVGIVTTCTNCKKTSKPISVEIDYSPTDKLIEKPITFCEKPNIKYKYTELTSFWTKEDLDCFMSFMFNDLKLKGYCWYFKQPENIRVFECLTLDEVMRKNDGFLTLFLTNKKLEKSQIIKFEDEKGVFIERDIWRKQEIIKISSTRIYKLDPLYYITFCDQYIHKGNVNNKSEEFKKITTQLKNWLKNKFISKRGAKCFDGEEAYKKFIA